MVYGLECEIDEKPEGHKMINMIRTPAFLE
jgi:hypothetical protein